MSGKVGRIVVAPALLFAWAQVPVPVVLDSEGRGGPHQGLGLPQGARPAPSSHLADTALRTHNIASPIPLQTHLDPVGFHNESIANNAELYIGRNG